MKYHKIMNAAKNIHLHQTFHHKYKLERQSINHPHLKSHPREFTNTGHSAQVFPEPGTHGFVREGFQKSNEIFIWSPYTHPFFPLIVNEQFFVRLDHP